MLALSGLIRQLLHLNLLYGLRDGLQWCSMGAHVFLSCTGHYTVTMSSSWIAWGYNIHTYVHAPYMYIHASNVSLQFFLLMCYSHLLSVVLLSSSPHLSPCPLVSSCSLYIPPTSPTVFVVSFCTFIHIECTMYYVLHAWCVYILNVFVWLGVDTWRLNVSPVPSPPLCLCIRHCVIHLVNSPLMTALAWACV